MKAGALDRRVTLQHVTLTRNEHGEQVESYTTYATVWAQKLDVLGREIFSAQTEFAERSSRFRLRYRGDVLLTDRLVYGTTNYDLISVAELGRREGLEIVAAARVD